MLEGPRFARACYAMFAVAVLLAVLKLGVQDARPLFLNTAPVTPVAKASEPATERKAPEVLEREVPEREAPDLRRAAEPTPGPVGRLLAGSSGGSSREKIEVPVFHRPSSGDSGGPVCGDLGSFPKSSRVVFPLPDEYFNSYDDTWGAARPQGGHEGSDLMSPAGTPEFAITDGTLVPVKGSNENGWNRLGGYTVMLKAAYDAGPIREGDLFYYAHMDEKSSLPIGTEVRAGQQIGFAGDTGEGPEATRGKFPSHLHLGWYDGGSAGDRANLESGAMNPYPLLLWLEQNGGAVSGGADAAYCEAPQGPAPEPSTGESSWPAQRDPGTTPDLDTGYDNDPRPSPAIEENRQRHDHPSKRAEPARTHGSVEENARNEKKVSTKREKSKASPRSGSKKRDERRADTPNKRASASSDDRTSCPSGDRGSTQKGLRDAARPFLNEPSRPDRAPRPFYASILADTLREARMGKDRDEQRAPGEEKPERSPGSTESRDSKERESAPEPDAASTRPRPASDSAPATRETSKTSREKTEPEEQKPEEERDPPGEPDEKESGEGSE